MMQNGRALNPGTMVNGDWRIEKVLGAGGFGVTYMARSRIQHERVALKEHTPRGLCARLPETGNVAVPTGGDSDLFKRTLESFMKEAELLGRLDHPSIVRAKSYFEANGTAYMALEYLEGETLADWSARLGRRPTQKELDKLLWPILDALIHLHSIHALHRDIKPENIMFRRGMEPVLIDFGAVKTLASSRTRRGPGTLHFLTESYAAPELHVSDGGNLLGAWTDIYSLAATVYQAISGRPPPPADRRQIEDDYQPLAGAGSNSGELLAAGIAQEYRPEFLATIDKALDLKRSARPQSAIEMRRALGLTSPTVSSDTGVVDNTELATGTLRTEIDRLSSKLSETEKALASAREAQKTFGRNRIGAVLGAALLTLAGYWAGANEPAQGGPEVVRRLRRFPEAGAC